MTLKELIFIFVVLCCVEEYFGVLLPSTVGRKKTSKSVAEIPNIYAELLKEEKDFTAPHDLLPGFPTCLLDYIINRLILPKKNDKNEYLNMHFITPCITSPSTNGKCCSQIPESICTCNPYNFKGKLLIMPIYRPGNHAYVLLADTDKKILQIYDLTETVTPTKILENFMKTVEHWNTKISRKDSKIDTEGWTTEILFAPRVYNDKDVIRDYGIYVVQFLDSYFNGKPKFRIENSNDDYYRILREAVLKHIWQNHKSYESNKNDLENQNNKKRFGKTGGLVEIVRDKPLRRQQVTKKNSLVSDFEDKTSGKLIPQFKNIILKAKTKKQEMEKLRLAGKKDKEETERLLGDKKNEGKMRRDKKAKGN